MTRNDDGTGFTLGACLVGFATFRGIRFVFEDVSETSALVFACVAAISGGVIGHAIEKGLFSKMTSADLTAHLYRDSYGGQTFPDQSPDSPRPSPLKAGETGCPRCPGVALHDRVCPKCKGDLWDPATVQEFARTRLHFESVDDLRRFASSEPDSKLACPTCAQRMKLVRLKGQEVDLCLGCGSLWADDAETAKIEAAANPML